MEGGQLGATGVPSHAHQVVSRHHHGPRDDHLVEDDRLERIAELRWIHLEDEEGVRETRAQFTFTSVDRALDCFSLKKRDASGSEVRCLDALWIKCFIIFKMYSLRISGAFLNITPLIVIFLYLSPATFI